MTELSFYPVDQLLMERHSLRRQLSSASGLQPIRIAVLGGSTTNELVDMLELFLLESEFAPSFHQSEYGRFSEDAVHDPRALIDFSPDVEYLHTSVLSIQAVPPVHATEADLNHYVAVELERFRTIWQSLDQILSCQIIQNNFELPPHAILGNMDIVASGGRSRFVLELNAAFVREASKHPKVMIQDVF